jgi:transposase, IS5 family
MGDSSLFRDFLLGLCCGSHECEQRIPNRLLHRVSGRAVEDHPVEHCLNPDSAAMNSAPADYKFRVYTSGQKRRLTPQIKRELRRRAAIEPVIGHLKAEHRLGRNYLAHHAGDAVNAVLAAADYNFHLLLKWLELLLSRFLAAQKAAAALQ